MDVNKAVSEMAQQDVQQQQAMQGSSIEKAIREERSRQNIMHFQVCSLGLSTAKTQGCPTGADPACLVSMPHLPSPCTVCIPLHADAEQTGSDSWPDFGGLRHKLLPSTSEVSGTTASGGCAGHREKESGVACAGQGSDTAPLGGLRST